MIMFTLILKSSLLGGPDLVIWPSLAAAPSLNHSSCTAVDISASFRCRDHNWTQYVDAFLFLHSNTFKYHVFSTLRNETRCFVAFGQLLQFELMISEKTVTQPSSRSWNWRKCKCYLVKEVLLRIFSPDALHHSSVLKCSCCLSNLLNFVRSLLVFFIPIDTTFADP